MILPSNFNLEPHYIWLHTFNIAWVTIVNKDTKPLGLTNIWLPSWLAYTYEPINSYIIMRVNVTFCTTNKYQKCWQILQILENEERIHLGYLHIIDHYWVYLNDHWSYRCWVYSIRSVVHSWGTGRRGRRVVIERPHWRWRPRFRTGGTVWPDISVERTGPFGMVSSGKFGFIVLISYSVSTIVVWVVGWGIYIGAFCVGLDVSVDMADLMLAYLLHRLSLMRCSMLDVLGYGNTSCQSENMSLVRLPLTIIHAWKTSLTFSLPCSFRRRL